VRTPGVLQALAVGFVAALFFEGMLTDYLPARVLPSTAIAALLAFLFVVVRLAGTESLRGPQAAFFGFLAVTAALEFARSLLEAGPVYAELSSMRAYLQFAQAVVLYLILQELLRDPRLYRKLVVALFLCTLLMSAASFTGWSAVSVVKESGRAGVLGLNLNAQSFLYAMSIIGAVTYLLEGTPGLRMHRAWLLVAIGLMATSLVRTGSRGGAVALVVGLAVATTLNAARRRLPRYVVLFAPLTIGLLAVPFLGGTVLKERFEATVERGDTGLRRELAQGGIEIFSQSPLAGRGATYVFELGDRVLAGGPRQIAAHNAYLQILLSFGLLGAVPWFVGLGLTMKRAWAARRYPWGAVMTALMVSSLAFGSIGNLGYNKFFWVLLALATRVDVTRPGPMAARVPLVARKTGVEPLVRLRKRAGARGR
jgi:O-antigen ligase